MVDRAATDRPVLRRDRLPWLGDPARRSAPCRGRSRPRSPPCSGSPTSRSSAPAAPTPVSTRAARSCTSTCPRRTTSALLRRLNGILPPDIRVRAVAPGPEGFDARFSAVWRRYAYRVVDDPALVDPLIRGHVLALAAAARPVRDERGLLAAAGRSRTSPRSASSARAPRRSAPCSTSTGRATRPGSRSARCEPTRSATTWSARWSAACWPSGRGVGRRRGRRRSWPPGCATRPSPSYPPTG